HLLNSPGLAGLWVSLDARRRERVAHNVICRMHSDELTVKSGHKFSGRELLFFERARNLIGVCLAFRATMKVEEARVRARQLQPFVAKARRPFRDPSEGVEWRAVTRKLCDEQRWSLDCTHPILLIIVPCSFAQSGRRFPHPQRWRRLIPSAQAVAA